MVGGARPFPSEPNALPLSYPPKSRMGFEPMTVRLRVLEPKDRHGFRPCFAHDIEAQVPTPEGGPWNVVFGV